MPEQITLKEHMKKIASLGGKALFKKRGPKYYSELAKKGWINRRKKFVKK